MRYKILYIKDLVEAFTTAYGFSEVHGIESYKGAKLRDRVVFRFDLLFGLNKFFTPLTLIKYRQMLYNIIAGNNRNKDLISQIFKALYLEDCRFREFLGNIIYFDKSIIENSLYHVVITSVQEVLENRKIYLIEEMRKNSIKYIADSHCFLYASVLDRDFVVRVPDGYGEEVVSHAKVWQGYFSKY